MTIELEPSMKESIVMLDWKKIETIIQMYASLKNVFSINVKGSGCVSSVKLYSTVQYG